MSKLNQEQIRQLIESGDLILTDVIDVVIEINALIGVGLISLSENISRYIINNRKGYKE